MKPRHFIIAIAMILGIGGIGYAMGPGGGSGGGGMGGSGHGMMGGGGYGMMDDRGHDDMMGSGQNYFSPRSKQFQRPRSYQPQMRYSDRLRAEIRQKRNELSELLRSENPDREMIEQKMAELNRLEAELDYEMSPN